MILKCVNTASQTKKEDDGTKQCVYKYVCRGREFIVAKDVLLFSFNETFWQALDHWNITIHREQLEIYRILLQGDIASVH